VALVQHALDLGINFIDTAEAYGTEAIVGQALEGRTRDQVFLSTKKTMTNHDVLITPDELVKGLEDSLQRLGTDYVDVYHLHGVRDEQYDYARDNLVPLLLKLKAQGKIRFLGITEVFAADPAHLMMQQAVQDDYWDVVMVGFNILNQSARDRIFPHTQQRGIGVLNMFAVRQALSQPAKLRQTIAELIKNGSISREVIADLDDPLGFLTGAEDSKNRAESLPDAAYRFCRAEPGVHVVLSGTGNVRHLEENVASIMRPPLPLPTHERLCRIFAGVDSVSGQ
jgi:aryl-alcohol dehydrogenase-like predicted oxidoreductase